MNYLTAICVLMVLSGNALADGSGIYTLYRNSIVMKGARLHIATFDAIDGELYNQENCEVAATLFSKQPKVKTTFWCEKGNFKK